jgi:hypothetical protein
VYWQNLPEDLIKMRIRHAAQCSLLDLDPRCHQKGNLELKTKDEFKRTRIVVNRRLLHVHGI